MSNIKYITNYLHNDGFGSQYQNIISVILIALKNNFTFIYSPFTHIEHNYENDSFYIEKIEKLINIKNHFSSEKSDLIKCESYQIAKKIIDDNINYYATSENLNIIKNIFWKNKINNEITKKKYAFGKDGDNVNNIHLSIHIRRKNIHDPFFDSYNRYIENHFFYNILSQICYNYDNKEQEKIFTGIHESIYTERKTQKKIIIHIFSQGDINDFICFQQLKKTFLFVEIIFHLNEDITKSFVQMVASDILVISPSSFSYSAALISDGDIYYKPFWHNPLPHWKKYE
jgi:hypothetical protein